MLHHHLPCPCAIGNEAIVTSWPPPKPLKLSKVPTKWIGGRRAATRGLATLINKPHGIGLFRGVVSITTTTLSRGLAAVGELFFFIVWLFSFFDCHKSVYDSVLARQRAFHAREALKRDDIMYKT